MAMNRHFFGSDHGEPLDIFSGLPHTDSFQDGRGEVSTMPASSRYSPFQRFWIYTAAYYLPPYQKLGPRKSNGANHQMPVELPKYSLM